MSKPVRVRSAPGLVWKKRDDKWEARWQARTDLVKRGYQIKSAKLWSGLGEPTKEDWDWISDRCNELQNDMVAWAKGDIEPASGFFDGTLGGLMQAYKSDPDSRYRKIRYHSRIHYDALMELIRKDSGDHLLKDLKARTFLRWHEDWSAAGKLSLAHSKIGMLRILFGFGATILEDDHCARLSGILSKTRFEMAKPRSERLTADQANAIRAKAHEVGWHSIALAQAFQFEIMLRQKDVVGEWIPLREPGVSDIQHESYKWLRGLRWEEISKDLMLSHVTSKRNKLIEVNLRNAPMVMEELQRLGELPANGPLIVCERDKLPWTASEFRRQWRLLADSCGVPKTVRNMDSRAGAISEASDAGADLEHIRHAATHSNISMTQRYSRAAENKIENVQKLRAEHRNKSGTK